MEYTKSPVAIKLKRHLPGLAVFAKWLGLRFSRRSFLRKAGFFKSVRYRASCKLDGSPLPWMNYAVIAILEERLNPKLSLFEYGSGNSTMFFSSRVGHVVSLEKDARWYDHVAKAKLHNVKLILCEPYSSEAYLKVIGQQRQLFDVVVVDAEKRGACLREAVNWLTPGGVVLLDDANEEVFGNDMDAIVEQGFKRLIFEGMKPGSFSNYRTAVFYRNDNVLGL